jgi:hypothetical protein
MHHLTHPQSEKLLMPAYIILTTMCASFVTFYFKIPRVRRFRIAIGIMSAIFMIVSEAIVGMALYEEGWGDWLFEVVSQSGILFGIAILWFALAPWQ